jgi:hypothetical protein
VVGVTAAHLVVAWTCVGLELPVNKMTLLHLVSAGSWLCTHKRPGGLITACNLAGKAAAVQKNQLNVDQIRLLH